MKVVNIRCCCDAGKLLGSVPTTSMVVGKSVEFLLTDGTSLTLDWGTAHVYDEDSPRPHRELALKSNDTPIEKLRMIPGFEEK